METKPLIILGSNRKNSLTETIIRKALNNTEFDIIDLLDYTIVHYNYDGHYPAADEFDDIVDKILSYQNIIFATPVYWYSMSGIMKVFFDRLTDLITIKKELGRKLKGKTASMIAVGADPAIPDGFETPFKHTAAYLGIQYQGCTYYATK
ncbi:flavodoxin family protein [Mucilaginibacter litoreus]|uniref:Flavodoxin family protein n=1 Tax=Mucilaginibacter litoreus TaxID=1048221 RepID=A0ABW3ATA7_9SPHI